jgi:lipoate-protein ligase B
MTDIPDDNPPCQNEYSVQYLGLVLYESALVQQEALRQLRAKGAIPDTVLLFQHPHVYTTGRFHGEEDIIASPDKISIVRTNRGGSITYHGPGQLVGYPILDLRASGLGVREYIWKLEEVIIRLLDDFGIEARRNDDHPGGVWTGSRKICSIGINVSRHITMHGFALNVNTDLRYYNHIKPCGLRAAEMTSMAEVTGREVPFATVVHKWVHLFSEVFALRPEYSAALAVEEAAIV